MWLIALSTASVFATFRGGTCKLQENTVIGQGNIKQTTEKSADDCCQACFNYGYQCAAFTFQPSTGDCFLKNNAKGNSHEDDRISGTTGSSPGPAPADNRTVVTRACLPDKTDHFPYCNTSLSIDERVDNLISLLNEDEIPPLLTAREGGGGSPGPPGNVSRIGLPEYDWGVNCIHGVQTTCGKNSKGEPMCPTSFPNPNALGASFNKSAWLEMGQIIGKELRSLWLHGATEASSWSGRPHAGLDCWSPNVNINRDPRWGRNQEVPSEDPYINGQFGSAYTVGLQNGTGEDPRYVQAVVTLKHWDAYSLENSDGFTRHNFNAVVDNHTLADTYFPAFKECVVNGKALGVMCSYNSVNGVPTCADPFLNSVLREEWGFQGYVTSDTGAVSDIYKAHHYAKGGGCDIDSGSVYHGSLLDGVKAGHCSMDDVKIALRRTLGLRFKLGLFDPIDDQPYWHVSPDAVNTTTSQATNLRMTQETLVLLKNDPPTTGVGAAPVLPLSKSLQTVAVIGPHYNAQKELVGNYLGEICPGNKFDCFVDPASAIAAKLAPGGGKVVTAVGTGLTQNCTDTKAGCGIAAALAAAKGADAIVLAIGIGQAVEGESHDRSDIALPLVQHQLIAAVRAAYPNTPTAMFLLNGGMLDIAAEKESVPAILECFYPGFWGGQAIADTLFGDNEHLGGKMPFTIYPEEYITQVKMSDMSMAPSATSGSPGRSYRYYTGNSTYPFGHGLSLTTFKIKDSTIATATASTATSVRAMRTGELAAATEYKVTVTNMGSVTGDEVVLAFFKPQVQVIRQLFGFERVHLAPGASVTVTFPVTPATVRLVDRDTGDLVSTPGVFELEFTNGVDQSVRHALRMEGEERVLEKFPSY